MTGLRPKISGRGLLILLVLLSSDQVFHVGDMSDALGNSQQPHHSIPNPTFTQYYSALTVLSVSDPLDRFSSIATSLGEPTPQIPQAVHKSIQYQSH
jgi:hypothetical protein